MQGGKVGCNKATLDVAWHTNLAWQFCKIPYWLDSEWKQWKYMLGYYIGEWFVMEVYKEVDGKMSLV